MHTSIHPSIHPYTHTRTRKTHGMLPVDGPAASAGGADVREARRRTNHARGRRRGPDTRAPDVDVPSARYAGITTMKRARKTRFLSSGLVDEGRESGGGGRRGAAHAATRNATESQSIRRYFATTTDRVSFRYRAKGLDSVKHRLSWEEQKGLISPSL